MSGVAIGVDVGGTKIMAMLVDREGRVLGEASSPTPHEASAVAGLAVARTISERIQDLSREFHLEPGVAPVGLGVPGMVRRDGRLAFAPNLDSASGADLTALVAEMAGGRAWCDNDANCAARAEHQWGAARTVDDFVMVTLGTGIGGGVVANGQLVRGRSGFAGEIGHMVVEANGAPCPCGGRGCWERYASGGGLARLARERALAGDLPELVRRRGSAELVRAEDVTSAATEGLVEAQRVLDEVAWWLALGLANLVAILDAGHFVIGGGLSSVADLLLPAARGYLNDLVEGGEQRPSISVTASAFGPQSGAMGAALLAFEQAS